MDNVHILRSNSQHVVWPRSEQQLQTIIIEYKVVLYNIHLPRFGANATSWTGSKTIPTMLWIFCHFLKWEFYYMHIYLTYNHHNHTNRASSLYSKICRREEAIAPGSSIPTTIIGGWILSGGDVSRHLWLYTTSPQTKFARISNWSSYVHIYTFTPISTYNYSQQSTCMLQQQWLQVSQWVSAN